jgi:hypothetical protein
MNAVTKKFEHPLAEGYGLSEDDTYQRYADEFRTADIPNSVARSFDQSAPAISGKASLYALIVSMWGAITFGVVMAMVFGG